MIRANEPMRMPSLPTREHSRFFSLSSWPHVTTHSLQVIGCIFLLHCTGLIIMSLISLLLYKEILTRGQCLVSLSFFGQTHPIFAPMHDRSGEPTCSAADHH